MIMEMTVIDLPVSVIKALVEKLPHFDHYSEELRVPFFYHEHLVHIQPVSVEEAAALNPMFEAHFYRNHKRQEWQLKYIIKR